MATERDYEVGHGKPPIHTRFPKGHSGNPKGRPEGAKNLSTIVNRALNERVTVKENGRQRKITKREAMVTQLANKGASGDHRSIQLLLNYLQQEQARSAGSNSEPTPVDTDDQHVLDGLIQRLTGEKQPNGAEGDEEDETEHEKGGYESDGA
jgi:uncharacterized protein DUF5681